MVKCINFGRKWLCEWNLFRKSKIDNNVLNWIKLLNSLRDHAFIWMISINYRKCYLNEVKLEFYALVDVNYIE